QADVSALADEPLHFAAEDEKHVHFNREPNEPTRRMNESVGRETPDLAAPQHPSAVKHHEVEHAAPPGCDQEAGDDGKNSMAADQNGRDIDRETTHPRHWPIVIRGSDSEHH